MAYGVHEPKNEDETTTTRAFSNSEVVPLAVLLEAIPDVAAEAKEMPAGMIVVDCANPVAHDFTGLSLSGTVCSSQRSRKEAREVELVMTTFPVSKSSFISRRALVASVFVAFLVFFTMR